MLTCRMSKLILTSNRLKTPTMLHFLITADNIEQIMQCVVCTNIAFQYYYRSLLQISSKQPVTLYGTELFTGWRPLRCPCVSADWTLRRHAESTQRPTIATMAECARADSHTSGHTMDKSITLPPDEIFRNLENAKRFAIDIGTGDDVKSLCYEPS